MCSSFLRAVICKLLKPVQLSKICGKQKAESTAKNGIYIKSYSDLEKYNASIG